MAAARKPWISGSTLALISRRSSARRLGHKLDETTFHKETKAAVKRDRAHLLVSLAASGDWLQIRRIRKGHTPKQGQLGNAADELISSERRATTLAFHLETAQWAARPMTMKRERTPTHGPIPAKIEDVCEDEVATAAHKLRCGRACGLDGAPGEYWKAVACPGSSACRWAVDFCRACWNQKSVSDCWREACVTIVFQERGPGGLQQLPTDLACPGRVQVVCPSVAVEAARRGRRRAFVADAVRVQTRAGHKRCVVCCQTIGWTRLGGKGWNFAVACFGLGQSV